MKRFRCGDLVPGCQVEFTAQDTGGLAVQILRHANRDHSAPEVVRRIAAYVEQLRSDQPLTSPRRETDEAYRSAFRRRNAASS